MGSPIVYVPAGTTLLRFYMDSDNRVTRTFSRHKMNKLSVPCLDEGCEICAYLSGMDEKYPNFRGAWKLYPVETTIVYAWIFSCSEENNSIRIGTPVLLMGDHKLGQELDDHILDMDGDTLRKMLDPLADDVLWELKSSSGHLSLAPTLETGTMNPLPTCLHPLSQCINAEREAPTEDQISKFIKLIDDAYRPYVETAA